MKILTITLSSLLVCCCLLSTSLPAQAQQSSAEQITLALDDADIRDLILWAQEVVDKSIIIHPNVKGKVTVMAGEPMTRGEAYQVFLSTLQVHGFTVVESGSVIKVIPDALAKQTAVPMVDSGSESDAEEIQVQIIKVQNISVAQLANLLRPLVPQVGHLAAYPATNSLIIADRASNIQKILDIVSRLDKVGVVDIELLPLQFASAKEVVEVLNKLLVPTQRGAAASAEVQDLQLAVDERSNSILLTGDPAARIQIRKLVARLDQPLSGEGNTQVFYLNYTTAEEMVPILESVAGNLQKNQKDKAASETEIGVKASESLNALVITAPPSVLNTMKGVIARLDKRRAQVLVEALIVEVNQDVNTDLGIEWWGRSGDVSAALGSFSSDRLNQTMMDGLVGDGLSLGYFRGGNLRALINALSTEKNVNILSTPTIMALDNEEAEILVGSNVPFKQGSQLRDGNDDPFVTFERQDIGITLKVKPRVNNNDSVTLEIEQSVEDVTLPPPGVNAEDGTTTDKREIKTKVLIDNDQILVLGGLIKDTLDETESRVPLLGSIPLIGRLFRSTTSATVKSNLMVFIHPVILPDPASSFDASRERYDRIQQSQQEFRGKIESYFVPRQIPVLPQLQEPRKREPAASDGAEAEPNG